MNIGLFFGSFNPVHVGHMIIAEHIAANTDLDRVWMVVSPQNPLKNKNTLAKDHDRLHLVQLAIGDNSRLRASSVEFKLPKPSYTIDTLAHLRERHPEHTFSLVMGGDNLASLTKWKNYDIILRDYQIYVYSRPNYDLGDLASHPNIRICKAPLLDISASYIRENIVAKRSIRYLVPEQVFEYLQGSSMYK